MKTPKDNGLTTPHSQPAKTLTKYAAYFISKCTKLATGFYIDRGIDLSFIACCVALVLAVLMGVLQ